MGPHLITPYGGITVMLPAALVIGAWLWTARSKRSAMLWGATIFFAYSTVVLSKVLFKGWGMAIESLGIYVLSGHAMNTCLILTVSLSLLARQLNHRLRWAGATLGLTLGWLYSVFCVAPFIHPLAEAIAGALVGSLAASAFLLGLEGHAPRRIPSSAVVVGLLFIAISSTTTKYNAERLLDRISVKISGSERAFKQPDWRAPAEPL
ncbi:hypothetical protein N015_16125 [Pseudomonas asturiensis]|uniref:PAP2 superfamily protein n=1 Tax=Pseudomonas asturiensis TaxID=1190415 RepID=A0ABX6HEV3_9PSED|nr:hypothetical protein [Pseudomonas asturiensis]QHF03858.1 hypothetical protein N015_16125 [Pseudomonas asturiensis]